MPSPSIRATLDRLRTTPAPWPELADPRTRGAVLVALSYDRDAPARTPVDSELAREVLRHEVHAHEHGVGDPDVEDLRRACYLVWRLRTVSDVWLLVRAKLANYDSFGHIYSQLLYPVAAADTVAHVRASADPQRDSVLEELAAADGTPRCADAEIAEFAETLAADYPGDPDADAPLAVARSVLRFGTPGEVVPWLERWARDPRLDAERSEARSVADAVVAAEPSLAERIAALAL